MSDVQIAVVDQQDTQIVLAVPGVQGATGSEIPTGGTADQVLRKSSSTNYDTNWSQVTSAMIADGTIVNADINASAAIAGTKISPDFGSQTVQTTGVISHALGTAGAPTVTFTGDTNTGIYSPGADQVAISAGGTGRLFVDASGNVLVGTASSVVAGYKLQVNGSCGVTSTANAAIEFGIRTPDATFDDSYLSFGTPTQNRAQIYCTGGAANTGSLVFNTYNAGAGSERLRITSAGLVGIGTSSPQVLLHGTTSVSSSTEYAGVGFLENSLNNVDTSPTTAFPVLKLTRAGKSGASFRSSASFGIARYENPGTQARTRLDIALGHGDVPQPDTTVMSLLSSGAVGIGTTSPSEKLTVDGSLAITWGSGRRAGMFYDNSIRQGLAFDDSNRQLKLFSTANDSGGTIAFYTRLAGGSSDTDYGTERARIDSSGRLLVGTSSARDNYFNTSGLGGLLQIEGANSQAQRVVSNTYGIASGAGPIVVLAKHRSNSIGGNTVVQSGDYCGELSFQGSDGTEFVELANIAGVVDGTPGANDMPGRLVFSTTADGASSPTERMRIGSGGHLYATCNDTSLASLTLRKGAAGADGIDYLQCRDSSNTAQLVIAANGNVTNTNNSYGAFSDLKLKENVVDANSQWDDLKALQVRKYNFKEGQTHTQIGLVAQEVELVSPGLVTESPDRDAEGNDLGTTTKSVNYSVLYMKAVKALQEAMERIETLEAKVAALESA